MRADAGICCSREGDREGDSRQDGGALDCAPLSTRVGSTPSIRAEHGDTPPPSEFHLRPREQHLVTYMPIKVWENPNDSSDFLIMTQLAGRRARHADFNSIAGTCGIVVGADGHCQRDTVELINTMYSRYKGAMRSNFSSSRPAQPVLYLDATGASLGRGVTHAEVGSADFDGDAKQSQSSLVPLALYEDSDKAVPLRDYLDLVIPSYNRLIRLCEIKVDGVSVPCQPITSADMQGTKSFFGMCSSSHPVWCKCQKGIDQQHKYPSSPSTTYEEMLSYCEEEVGCEIKSNEEIVLLSALLTRCGTWWGLCSIHVPMLWLQTY